MEVKHLVTIALLRHEMPQQQRWGIVEYDNANCSVIQEWWPAFVANDSKNLSHEMNDGWWWMNEVHVVGYGIQISVLFTDVQPVEFFYWKWAYCLGKVVVLITQPIFRKHL